MNATCRHRMQVVRALRAMVPSEDEAVSIEQALDLCEASDVRQIAWENAQAGVKVSANTLLAMALSRAITRQLAEQFMLKEQLKQAKQAVTSSGDKRST